MQADLAAEHCDTEQRQREEAGLPCQAFTSESGKERKALGAKSNSNNDLTGSGRQGAAVASSSYFRSESAKLKAVPSDAVGCWAAFKSVLFSALESTGVQLAVILVVFVDFMFVLVDTDCRAAKVSPPWYSFYVTTICLFVYIFEFGARTFCHGKFFLMTPLCWLDAMIIIFGLVDLVLSSFDFKLLNLLRLVRLMRLIKLTRFIRGLAVFKELLKLVQMIQSCMRTLIWAVLMSLIMMMVWGCISVELIHPLIEALVEEGEWSDCERCRRAYSSVPSAIITFFQTIVAGDSWGLVPVPVMEAYPWSCIIFMGTHLTLVFGVLQLIVCVVVDRFAEIRETDMEQRAQERNDHEKHDKKVLLKLFEQIDEDGSGQVTLEELIQGAEQLPAFAQRLTALDIGRSDLTELFEMLDEDGSGEIDPEEFIETIYRMTNAESKTAVSFIKHMMQDMKRRQEAMNSQMDEHQEKVLHKAMETADKNVRAAVQRLESTLSDLKCDIDERHKEFKQDSVRAALQALAETQSHMESTMECIVNASLEEALGRCLQQSVGGLLQDTFEQVASKTSQALADKLDLPAPWARLVTPKLLGERSWKKTAQAVDDSVFAQSWCGSDENSVQGVPDSPKAPEHNAGTLWGPRQHELHIPRCGVDYVESAESLPSSPSRGAQRKPRSPRREKSQGHSL